MFFFLHTCTYMYICFFVFAYATSNLTKKRNFIFQSNSNRVPSSKGIYVILPIFSQRHNQKARFQLKQITIVYHV